jgi:hypothetical protein
MESKMQLLTKSWARMGVLRKQSVLPEQISRGPDGYPLRQASDGERAVDGDDADQGRL